jgi:glycerophosphoryl diester phosphodiesterase
MPPIAFAHRGARAHAPENTLEAFDLAKRLGATGLESDVYVTADGVVVLDHDGVVRTRFRKRRIGETRRADLPSHIPSLAEFYDHLGGDLDLSLDVEDPAAFGPTVDLARSVGAERQLWLCHPEIDLLSQWRHHTSARLVNSARLHRIEEGVERRAATLAAHGIDALNMHASDWNAGQVALVHRFERFAFGWDAQQHRAIATLVDIGIDGVFSDHVDRLHETFAQFFRLG